MIEQSRQEADNYDQRIQTLKDDLKSVRKAKDEGMYTLEQAKAEADEIQQKLTVLEIERSDIRIEQYNTEVVKEFSERFMRNLPLLWDNLDLPKRQALLSKVFQGTIIAGKDKIIRTSKLSPSFELIQSLAEEKGENVSILYQEWNNLTSYFERLSEVFQTWGVSVPQYAFATA